MPAKASLRLIKNTLCLIGLLLFPSIAFSSDFTGSLELQIRDRTEEIKQLIGDRRDTQELLGDLKQQEWGVIDVLKGLNRNIELAQAKLHRLELHIRDVEEELSITLNKMAGLHLQIDEDKKRIYQELYALFYLQKVRKHTFFLGMSSFQHYFRNQQLLKNIAEIDAKLIERLSKNLEEFEIEIKTRENQKREQVRLKKSQEEQQELLDFEQQQQLAYLQHIRQNRSIRVKVLRTIQVELERLNDAIHSLETRRQNEKKAQHFRGIYRYKYSLPSPVKGKVVHRFGQKNSRFYTLFKRGVLVKTNGDQDVKAILTGKVVWAGPFHGYANLVIVDHGKASFSVYGNLEVVFVAVNDVIEQNDIIGTVVYNASEEQHLFYFETRYNKKAVNPEQWLKKPIWN